MSSSVKLFERAVVVIHNCMRQDCHILLWRAMLLLLTLKKPDGFSDNILILYIVAGISILLLNHCNVIGRNHVYSCTLRDTFSLSQVFKQFTKNPLRTLKSR